MKDLIVHSFDDQDWEKLIRPLRTVQPQDSLEAVMQQLQKDGANMAVVVEGRRPIGLITLEDILEEVVGRIEDEYPRLPRLFLKEALTAGAIVLDLVAQTPEDAVRALAELIPSQSLPFGVDVTASALKASFQVVTDIGHGVAIPRTRCPGLARPLLVFGRLREGILFNEKSIEPVHLIFFLLTPSERPNVQVFLLEQLAQIAGAVVVRERLLRAQSPQEVFEIIAGADPAAGEAT
jgi:mannitol/fructose-specific phosphotransferase system IIA component (Ntr-type)